MAKKISSVIADLTEVYDEFGDVDVELCDTLDMDMYQVVTRVHFDQDRQRAQILSDR